MRRIDVNQHEVALEAINLTKTFPGVIANQDVSLVVRRGEIIALLGENGAGKSTLVKMIYGLYQPDSGEIQMNGELVRINGPRDAIRRGIGMVHQHFQLVPDFTVTQNVILGEEPRRWPFVNMKRAVAEVRELAQRYGLAVDPEARVEDLPVGTQQRVEILKALYRKADILIMDEPTAVLTPQETDELLKVMRGFADSGVAVVFITHKLREVMAVADRVEVLRGGRVVGTTTPAQTNQAGLAEMMVGRSVLLTVERGPANPGDVMVNVQQLNVLDDMRLPAVRDASFTVRAGEILGFAGVEGNGQRELVQALTGLRPSTSEALEFNGQDAKGASPHAIHAMGVGHVPEDREKDGLVGPYSISDNLVLDRFDDPQFARAGIRRTDAIEKYAETLVKDFDIRTPSIGTSADALSGGNKQKIVIARELAAKPKVLIASQPTRGVDVGSIEFIHSQIVAARDAGTAVMLVSAELDEILGLSDRIAVMYGGRIVAILDGANADRNYIGQLMAGGDAA